jgi:hypothetical protein
MKTIRNTQDDQTAETFDGPLPGDYVIVKYLDAQGRVVRKSLAVAMEIVAYDAAHCERYRTFRTNPQRDDPRAFFADRGA